MIGRITTEGQITEFPIPQALGFPGSGTSPFRITTGPDGKLWFAEAGSHKSTVFVTFGRIGRITIDGGTIDFPVPRTQGAPNDLTTGPDGNVWFTEGSTFSFRTSEIGRVSPDGTVSRYPLPVQGAGANRITTGPDGNLWFTESQRLFVDRITPGGLVTPFPIAESLGVGLDFSPMGITAGPDGALWFTRANLIGRITTDGAVSEYPLPTAGSRPGSITTGPDGALWFIEEAGNRIGRIIPPDPSVPAVPSVPPLFVTGSLDAGSDSGISHSDGITKDDQPTFVGTAYAGSTVRLFVQRSGQPEPVLVGQSTADPLGTWSITTTPLADGIYIVQVTVIDPAGRSVASQLLPGASTGPLVVDTDGPRVIQAMLRRDQGQLSVTYRDDSAGLDPASLTAAAAYSLSRSQGRGVRPIRVTGLRSTSGGEVVARAGGRARLPQGRYVLRINSSGIVDLAGNAVDGEFTRTLPSGDGRPGGDFAVRFFVRGLRTSQLRPLIPPVPHRGPPLSPRA
jgi:virginiamycin B lyase